VHGADAQGRPVLKRKLARGKVLEFFANLPSCLISALKKSGFSRPARARS
jgi:hypothetical protein